MLSHVDEQSRPTMVDVTGKPVTRRSAVAETRVRFPGDAAAALRSGGFATAKGPVFQTAIVAGVMAAKRTHELIPFCHPLGIEDCRIAIEMDGDEAVIRCTVAVNHRTGVEMEALTGASVAALTVYDMCKALTHAIVIAETRAETALQRFDEERDRLAELRSRVEELRSSAEVAEKLGHLLRADGFESWLMSSALEELVAAASVRLRELSGGQFSLVLDDRAFAVRDHANADEIRRARTLSGGETFLASLALALALAEATAALAPDGSPTIESIFLDEGFGTLDPEALDTVATAIEELGASGRMVGIVTHIRALADRMPVRLEVTKTAATSSVERVEV